MEITKELIQRYKPTYIEEYREDQVKAIWFVLESFKRGYKNCIVEAPTGIGKSIIAYVVAEILKHEFDKKTTITTTTKYLQGEYEKLGELDNLMSKSNYDCAISKEIVYNSPECKHKVHNNLCNPKRQCPYFKKRHKWMNSKTRLTNAHFFSEACSMICCDKEKGNKTDVTITDEAHNLPNVITEHSIIEFSIDKISDFLLSLPPMLVSFAENDKVRGHLMSIILHIKSVINSDDSFSMPSSNEFNSDVQQLKQIFNTNRDKVENEINNSLDSELKYLNSLHMIKEFYGELADMMDIVLNANEGLFMVEDITHDYLKIKPLRAVATAEWSYLRKGDFNVFMSATIPDVSYFMRELGLDNEKTSVLVLDSPFELSKRPIYFARLVNFNYKNRKESLDKLVKGIDAIADRYKGKRGLIHTVSYDNAEYIRRLSKHSNRMVVANGNDIKKYLNVERYPDVIILSPALYEGIDLKGDLVRFQVLIKVPYANLGDKFIKLRLDKYPDTYFYDTMTKIIQGYGRGMRDFDDYCDTFLLDENFERFIEKFPGWVKSAVKEIKGE